MLLPKYTIKYSIYEAAYKVLYTGQRIKSVFPGGMYVGKNTLRVESVFLCAYGAQKCAVRSEDPRQNSLKDYFDEVNIPIYNRSPRRW